MAKTTKQKLSAGDGAYLAFFIDNLGGDVLKWGVSDYGSSWCYIEILPPDAMGVQDSGKLDEA